MSSRVERFLSIFVKIIFIISLPFIALILSTKASFSELKIIFGLSFVIGLLMAFKFDYYKIIKDNFIVIYLILSIFIVLYLENNFIELGGKFLVRFSKELGGLGVGNVILDNITNIFLILLFPAMFILVYLFLNWVIPKVIGFWKNMAKFEKKFIIIYSVIGFVLIGVVYSLTNCFYSVMYTETIRASDVIYTTDSSNIFNDNAYLNFNMSENDLRQPLFGVFAVPFEMIAKIFSKVLFFIPNSYAIMLSSVQLILLGITLIFIMRMLKVKDINALLFLLLVLSSYTYILFSFVMEQYIISLFYLILTIYIGYFNKSKTNYLYIGAVGTLVTSGIIFPFISKFKNIKYWLKNVFYCFCAFVASVVISGQTSTFMNFGRNYKALSYFLGETVLFSDRVKQFLYFARSMFIAPSGGMVLKGGIPRYFMNDISFISILGIIILVICIVSFILNRKIRIAWISFGWVLFSFAILCIMGWGTRENGLILYSLYFAWAYLILVYLFIDKIFKNIKIKFSVVLGIVAIMIFFNLTEFFRILEFGMKYFN